MNGDVVSVCDTDTAAASYQRTATEHGLMEDPEILKKRAKKFGRRNAFANQKFTDKDDWDDAESEIVKACREYLGMVWADDDWHSK